MRVCSAITALGGLLFFYYSWQTHGFFFDPISTLGLTGLGASFWVYLATRGAYRDGVLTEEGAESSISGRVLKICFGTSLIWIRPS